MFKKRVLRMRKLFSKKAYRFLYTCFEWFKRRRYRRAKFKLLRFFKLDRRFLQRIIRRNFISRFLRMIQFIYYESLFILKQTRITYKNYLKSPYSFRFTVSINGNMKYKMRPLP
jgi:hypothetical protein